MLVTLVVLNIDKSRFVRLEQPSNIQLISVTLSVSKDERSRTISLEQPSNILCKFVILFVILGNFKVVNETQCANIPP